MIEAFPKVEEGTKIAAIERMLEQNALSFETIDYVYIVDTQSCLIGVASIKEIHSAKKDSTIDEIMKTKLVYAHPSTDQERMVYLALSHGIKAIPVVAQKNHL
jgi:magnesium transporter